MMKTLIELLNALTALITSSATLAAKLTLLITAIHTFF